jgi:hypothetical protein
MSDDSMYVLATDTGQAIILFALYQIAGDETALQMLQDGAINRTKSDAQAHRERAGTGEIFQVDYKITQCST